MWSDQWILLHDETFGLFTLNEFNSFKAISCNIWLFNQNFVWQWTRNFKFFSGKHIWFVSVNEFPKTEDNNSKIQLFQDIRPNKIQFQSESL